MVTTASALYVQTQLYWRERMGGISWDKDVTALRRQLDEQYVKSQLDGLMLESRLGVYFALPDAKRKWHRTMDLLTVRYFQVLEADSGRDRAARLRRLYEENEGDDHSGLNAADLNNAEKVLDGYRDALQQATHAVMSCQRQMGRRLRRRRGNRAIKRELHVHHQVEDTAAPQ